MKIRILCLAVLLCFAVGATEAVAAIDTSRLIVYWPCDDGGDELIDASGNGYDATIQDGNHSWEAGKFGQAVRLQQAYGMVEGDMASSFAETGEMTMACWFIMSSHSTYNGLISIEAPEGECCEYRMMVNPNKSPFWNMGHHVDQNLDGVFTFELDTWYHYVITGDGESGKVYIDGEFIGEKAEGFDLPDTPEVALYLGTGESPGTWPAEDAAFDEVTLWNKALTEDEVKELMGGMADVMPVEPKAKLVTTWAAIK